VALFSIADNLLFSASVKTLLSVALPTSVLISAAVWSAVALFSILSNFDLSLADILPELDPEAACNLEPLIAALAFISALTIVPSVIIVELTVPVSPDVITVPVVLGRVIVLFWVGSVTANEVWLLSSVVPSKDKLPFIVLVPSLLT